MRRNWPFFKDSDWLILVFVHSAKPTAELENVAMSPSLSSPGLSYDTKFVHIGWELRSSLVGDTILGVQSEPACNIMRLIDHSTISCENCPTQLFSNTNKKHLLRYITRAPRLLNDKLDVYNMPRYCREILP